MNWQKITGSLAVAALIAGCTNTTSAPVENRTDGLYDSDMARNDTGSTIWTLFDRPDNEATVQVNRYLWYASLDVLDFLPLKTVDPFTGLIVTDYGRPPGGGTSYRATVHISDPALDARSLSVSLQTQGGPVSDATTRAVEDAILSRARQLRIEGGKY
ncbi:MAG: hypothetical protein CML66_16170 [Rhodobacteraceae bacterium]|nr:hypothetical protein [Paracoccaceae bacterium]MAY44894.1 hypothetical protein [Paracoccaceae bacterium]QEW18132.1 hypothetical protein LA6_000291 [Marinibacterium anthonyi]|tara:strand:- start:341 stop:814 length:474 start_codon:yes stop_codon:yes gene_type:complete